MAADRSPVEFMRSHVVQGYGAELRYKRGTVLIRDHLLHGPYQSKMRHYMD